MVAELALPNGATVDNRFEVEDGAALLAELGVTSGHLSIVLEAVESDLRHVRVHLHMVLICLLKTKSDSLLLKCSFDLSPLLLLRLVIREVHFTFKVVRVALLSTQVPLHVHLFVHLLFTAVGTLSFEIWFRIFLVSSKAKQTFHRLHQRLLFWLF